MKLFLFSSLLLTIIACTNNKIDISKLYLSKPVESPLFQIGQNTRVNALGLQFPAIWNPSVLKKLRLNGVKIYSFGGKSPDDTLSVANFQFNWKSNSLNFFERYDDGIDSTWTKGFVKNTKKNTSIINFESFYGITKKLKTEIEYQKDLVKIYRFNSNKSIDTTFIIKEKGQNKAQISKIGNSIYSVDLFMPIGSSTSRIKKELSALSIDSSQYITAIITVVFMNKNQLSDAFLMNDELVQIAQTKHWEYDKKGNLSNFSEFIAGELSKEISFKYNKGNIPTEMSVNGLEYIFEYF